MEYSFRSQKGTEEGNKETGRDSGEKDNDSSRVPDFVKDLRKGLAMSCRGLEIKEGETKPPKRYNSGSMILAMENAGQLIEEEDLREQIRGSGIGTSATRAEILKKLFGNKYLSLNRKTQIITPTFMGEMIYDTVDCSIRSLLDPKLTASWELGLTRVADGTVTEEEYMEKLSAFVARNTDKVKNGNVSGILQAMYLRDSRYYKTRSGASGGTGRGSRSKKKE